MKRALLIGVTVVFVGLVVAGTVRQSIEGATHEPAVTALAGTPAPALQLWAGATATPTAIPPTITPFPAMTAPPPAATPEPQTHVVQVGETLFSIARQYGIPLQALAAANNMTNLNLVIVGQRLLIPTPAPAAEPATDTLAATSPPTPTAPASLNGVPLHAIIVMPPSVVANARAIFAQGQIYGRNPHAYTKVGDSTIQNPHFMTRFDVPGGYALGPYAYLQPAVDYFAGSHGREGMTVRQGFHAWSVTDPLWADKTVCQPNETPITCEIRRHNPAILLIRLGSNDAGVPASFDQNVRQVVELAIGNGIIPVIGTKADRFEGSNVNNETLRQIAADYQIPLWDFDVAAQMVPGRGLDVDNVHLSTFFAHDYGSPAALTRGHGVHSLTALMMLHALLAEVIMPAGG